jgi:type VI secretion system protein ImpJ
MMEISNPYFNGVVSLKHNQSSLLKEVFEIESLELLLTDGTLVNYPENAIVKPRSFLGDWTETLEPLTIYAGVKKLNKKVVMLQLFQVLMKQMILKQDI